MKTLQTISCPYCNGIGIMEAKEDGCVVETPCPNCEGGGMVDAACPILPELIGKGEGMTNPRELQPAFRIENIIAKQGADIVEEYESSVGRIYLCKFGYLRFDAYCMDRGGRGGRWIFAGLGWPSFEDLKAQSYLRCPPMLQALRPDPSDDGDIDKTVPETLGPECNADGTYNTRRADALDRIARNIYDFDREF